MKSLFELYREHQGKVSDKWLIYLSEYDRLFSCYRNLPVRMLEIGIQNGGSLEIWGKYFSNASVLVGCDINQDCSKLIYDDQRIKVVVGDANTDQSEKEVLSFSPNFDLIIDDGSHTSGDIVKSFARYFSHLNNGGIFIAEDLHCSYWGNYEGGLYYPCSSIAFFKRLADVVNHEHWGIEKERTHILRGFSEQFLTEFDESDLAQIHSIEFLNSLCVVHKRKAESNVLGERFIAGVQELVVTGHLGLAGSSSVAIDQKSNAWATMTRAPDEEWESLSKAVTERDRQIDGLNHLVTEREDEIASLDQAVAERDCQIARLSQLVAEREERVAVYDEAIHALRQSTSWRATAPLRWLKTQLLLAQRLAKLPLRALRLGGGLRSTLQKAVNLYRCEGISGLRRGAHFVLAGASSQQILLATGGEGAAVVAVDRNDYSEWVRRYDTLDEAARNAIRKRITEMENPPLISVVMPTYNSNPKWLAEAIESVQGQLYPHWELCIADDASPDPAVRPLLEKYAREDARIKLVFREQNGHISAASNSALQLVAGDWVALLDHDDLLSEHALYCVANSIIENPSVHLIYSDEDKINEVGSRHSPYFKCDWNPDLFYSHNMITHLGVYRTELVKKIGGFRIGFEGAQDYDLALRCIECILPSQIVHIPRILYHWRVHNGSTAKSSDSKPYAMLAGERAINEHFSRTGVKGKVTFVGHGYQVEYNLPEKPPLVSIIIPTRNGQELLEKCVNSILDKTTYENYEIIIVDNGSDDPGACGYLNKIKQNKRISVIRDESPFNYSYLNNKAVDISRGEIIALLNNDIEVITPDWLTVMVSHAIRPGIGAVGAKLWYTNKTLQHGGVILGIGGYAGHAHKHFHDGSPGYAGRLHLTHNVSAVTGACLIVKKEIFNNVGRLDEINLPIAYNDVDLCLRIRQSGYRNVWTPRAELFHHESATRGYEDTPEKLARFNKEAGYLKERWGDRLCSDPYYSPNLTLNFEDFSYAWPPRIELI